MSAIKNNGMLGYKALYPRMLNFGLSYGDLARVDADPQDWIAWSQALADQAARYEEMAEDAWLRCRWVSTMEGWRKATDYFHYAQLRLPATARKKELQTKCCLSFSRLAEFLNPKAERIEIPFKSTSLPGYLRLANSGAPCVILIGGLDSAKEVELCYFAECFLRRGNSVFFFDGPGQGELCGVLPMTSNFEEAVSTVIEYLTEHRLTPGHSVGLFGVSFGGYLACRAAAVDRRAQACISLGGFFDSRVFPRLSPLAIATFKRTFGLSEEEEDLSAIAPNITLEPLRGRMDRPLFVIHGQDDNLIDMNQIKLISEWACGPTRVWIMDGAEHVCTNRFGECLPELGDWMSEQLASLGIRSTALVTDGHARG